MGDDRIERVSRLLHEAGETHHVVWRIVDGDDPDWASWYSDWLINLSELPDVLGSRPVRSELTWLLVQLGKDYEAAALAEPWQDYYAREIVNRLGSVGGSG
jgi:hypothetical protein